MLPLIMLKTPPKTLGIRHIALKVRDLPAAERFYSDILGYAVEWRPDEENLYLARDADSLALHFDAAVQQGSALDHFGIALKTPQDVDAWAEYLKAGGIAFYKEPKTHRDGARSFYIKDPEGNIIQFIYHPPIANPTGK